MIKVTEGTAQFQLTAARRRLVAGLRRPRRPAVFQLPAARRRLGKQPNLPPRLDSFNSQPREGGWADLGGLLNP